MRGVWVRVRDATEAAGVVVVIFVIAVGSDSLQTGCSLDASLRTGSQVMSRFPEAIPSGNALIH